MRDLTSLDLSYRYERAKDFLDKSLNGDRNEFLAAEIPIRPDQIEVNEDSVSVTFRGQNRNEYLVETKLILLSNDKKRLGFYCLHENEKSEVVDDYIVFD